MTICVVTDRARQDPVAQARHAIDAGVDLIQIRERGLDGGALAAIVRAVVAIACASAGTAGRPRTRVVVNDRLDVAVACGADGVHLRSDSIAAEAARQMAPPGFLIGRSVHAVEQARSAGPVDYLIAGTVFRTASKAETAPLVGLEGLAAIVRASTAPVLAIGGITVERVSDVAAAGASGIAAIGLFASGGPLGSTVAELRMRFDTVKTAP
jgi:thiamine-phosphate pyrophosphorylase